MKKGFSTDRLLVSGLTVEDSTFFETLSLSETVKEFLGGPDRSGRIHEKFEEALKVSEPCYHLVVRRKEDQKKLGMVIIDLHHNQEDYEVSYLFLPKYWGKGYAREAVKAVLDQWFQKTKIPYIVAETQAKNIRSCKMLINIGMTEWKRLERFSEQQIIFRLFPD